MTRISVELTSEPTPNLLQLQLFHAGLVADLKQKSVCKNLKVEKRSQSILFKSPTFQLKSKDLSLLVSHFT